MRPNWLVFGALWGALGVAASAWGAHGMQESILEPKRQEWFLDAVRLQMWHAPLLVLVGWMGRSDGRAASRARLAGWFLGLGSLVFSGTLYGMAFGGPSILGAVTPLGGLSLILGWMVLATSALPEPD